jgi:hypothetical protein
MQQGAHFLRRHCNSKLKIAHSIIMLMLSRLFC